MALRQYSGNAISTTLTSSIGTTDTTITVAAVTGYPAVTPFFIVVDPDSTIAQGSPGAFEKMLVTARSGTIFTVTRAQDGTSAATHAQNAIVRHCWTATDMSDGNQHTFNTAVDNNTQYIRVDGTRAFTGLSQIANTTPGSSAIADVAAQGSSGQLARADHKHGRESSLTTQATAYPSGSVIPYGVATAPTGWLNCDGSAVSRTTFATLFGVISTTYGAGDGSTTFNVPDMRGRLPVGVGTGTGGGASGTGLPSGGATLTARALGAWIGEETHALANPGEIAAHNHGVTDPAHSHNMNPHNHAITDNKHGHNANGTGNFTENANLVNHLGLLSPGDGRSTYASGNTAAAASGVTLNNTTESDNTATTGITTNNQSPSGSTHNNVQPIMCFNFIIRT